MSIAGSNFIIHSSLPELKSRSVDKTKLTDPFLNHAFLNALEQQACVNGQTGWQTCHLELPEFQLLIPTYQKQHSYGEYVFDWSWAEAYHKHGLQYYPKLLSAIPFTPVTGKKYIGPSLTQRSSEQLTQTIVQICQQYHLSSWHFNFITAEDAELLHNETIHIRHGVQFEWFNQNYVDFDAFLSRFTSRKRKNVKKERISAQQSVDEITCLTGSDIKEADINAFYLCYQTTYLKRGRTGYLSEGFFQQLRQTMPNNMLLITAKLENEIVASALFFYDDIHLYGRYWGCLTELNFLHFELCFYQGIEFAIKHNLKHFNPGTQGEHKILRGFEPTLSYSAHYVKAAAFRPAIQNFCIEEQQQIAIYKKNCLNLLPFKQL